jgi:hypothetical protein
MRMLALAACLAAPVVAGCGSDDEGKALPRERVSALQRQLDSIENRFDAGACRDITEGSDTNLSVVRSNIRSLPDDVDPDVRDALVKSFNRLFELVQDQCEEPTQTDTTPTETTPTETETTPTETQTETTPTETQPTTPQQQQQQDGQQQQQGDGGGNSPRGDGNGGGGGQSAPGEG